MLLANTRVYRESVANSLARQSEFSLIACADAREGPRIVGRYQPDVVVIDLANLDAVETVRAILAAAPTTKVVALGITETEQHVVACAQAGVTGYVSREASLDEVVATVRRVMFGGAPCSPRVTGILLAAVARTQSSEDVGSRLTQREREILGLIEAGKSNKEIASGLCIEVTTVKNHVHTILEKLHVRRRTEAAALMRRSVSRSPAI